MIARNLSPRRHLWRPLVGVIVLVVAGVSLPRMMGWQLTATPLAIHVSGNHLVDGAGTAVTLHGADLSGTEFACDQSGTPTSRGWSIYGGQPLDQFSTFQAMQGWDIDVVRVPLNEDCWLGINGVNPAYGGANYQSAIATEVKLIHQAGMIAILDLHWNAPGAWAAIAQQPMADADHSIAFWQSLAAYFKSDPAVIFDLYNEPFLYGSYFSNSSQDPWACWLNGCSLNQFLSAYQVGPSGQSTGYTTTYTWQTAGMQQLIGAVRGAGATQPILVNGVDWANDDSGWLSHLPNDPLHQLIAGAHDYPGETCQTPSCWNSQQAPISTAYPFLVGETGDHTTAPVTFLPTFLPFADSHGWSYLAWTWNPWTYKDDVLITDWRGTPNGGEGGYYKQHLLSLGPSPFASPSGTPSSAPTSPSSTPTSSPGRSPSSTPTSTSGPLPITRVIGINLGGGAAGAETPLSAVPGEIRDVAQNLHVTWLRYGLQWFNVDPQLAGGCTAPSCYSWTVADTVFAAAAQYGIGVEAILGGAHWVNSTLVVPTVSEWQSYVTAFTQRYVSIWKPNGLRGFVIEPWNEPDQGSNWAAGASAFATLIQLPAYNAVKRVDSSVLVAMATTDWSTGGHAFWNGVASTLHGQRFVDLPGYHDYANSTEAWSGPFRSWLASVGIHYDAVWVSEFGGGMTPPAPYDDSTHIAVLQSQIPPVLTGTSADAAFYYAYKDLAEGGVVHESYGLMDEYGNHYQSYGVFQGLMASAPAPTPKPIPTPNPSPSSTSMPSPSMTLAPTPSPSGSGPSLPYTDTFASDPVGSVPAGWSVSGSNAGFAVAAGDPGYGHVYRHSGWTAITAGGGTSWTDYTLTVDVRPSAWASENDSIDFRYLNGDHHDAVRFLGGGVIDLVSVDGGTTTELAGISRAYSASWHSLSITAVGPSLAVTLDGTVVMAASDPAFSTGGIGFGANDPISFADVSVIAA